MGHVARTGETRNSEKFWSEHLNGIRHMENRRVEGSIILIWIFRETRLHHCIQTGSEAHPAY
jgi:hypothetical protein